MCPTVALCAPAQFMSLHNEWAPSEHGSEQAMISTILIEPKDIVVMLRTIGMITRNSNKTRHPTWSQHHWPRRKLNGVGLDLKTSCASSHEPTN